MADKFTIDDILKELEIAKAKNAQMHKGKSDIQDPISAEFTKEMQPVIRESQKIEDIYSQTKTIPKAEAPTAAKKSASQPGPDTIQFENIRHNRVDEFLKDLSFSHDDSPSQSKQSFSTLSEDNMPKFEPSWTFNDDEMVILQDDNEEEEVLPEKKKFSFFKRKGGRIEETEEDEEEESDHDPYEYNYPADAERIQDRLAKHKSFAILRLGVSTVCFVLLFYLAISNFVGIYLPSFMYPEKNMQMFLLVNIGVLLVSIIASAYTIGSGLVSFFTFNADEDSASSLAVLAAFGHGIALTVNSDFLSYGQGHFYFVAAALILLFSSIGGYFQIARIIENFDVISSNSQKKVILDITDTTHADAIVSPQAIEEPKVMYGTATPFPKGFIDASYSEGDGVTKFVVPLCLLLALAISGASYFLFEASVMSAITYFTAMLMVSCPLSISLIYNLPLYRCAKVLAPKGCCILGEKGVNDIEETSAILITGGDLYYGKNAPIYGIKPFAPDQLNQSITDMASIAVALNMPAKQSLLNIINNDLSLIRDLSSYQIIPERGVVTYIDDRKVLMGNRELMKMFHIAVPDLEYELKLKGDKKDLLYITGFDRLSAVFVVGYSAPSTIIKAVANMEKYGTGLSISSADPNITPNRVSKDFGYNKSYINLVESGASAYCEVLYKGESSQKSGIVVPTHPAMLLRCFNACFSIKRSINLATIIQMVGLLLGYAAVSFLAFTGSMNNLSFINMVTFQIVTAVAATVALLSSKT